MCKVDFKQKAKNKKIISIVMLHMLIAFLIFALIFIKFPCPFRFIFGIPCPACGTVHALGAIVHLDFQWYIQNNCLAIPMVLAFWLGVHKKPLFNNSRYLDFYIYIVCLLVVIRYFLKVFVAFL